MWNLPRDTCSKVGGMFLGCAVGSGREADGPLFTGVGRGTWRGDSHLRWEWHAQVEVGVGGCMRSAGTRREVREPSGAQVASDRKVTRRGHRAEDRIPGNLPMYEVG